LASATSSLTYKLSNYSYIHWDSEKQKNFFLKTLHTSALKHFLNIASFLCVCGVSGANHVTKKTTLWVIVLNWHLTLWH